MKASKIKLARPSIPTMDTRIVAPMPKEADPHYQSPEHKAWRLEVMRRARWRCQAPGCTVRYPERLFADHIVELRDGGAPFDPANGQAFCGSHHSKKTAQARAERARR